MANLAIKGHATRSKEVIEILEMLGGTNSESCWGVFDNRLYSINAFGVIEDKSLRDNSNYQVYTLEEFLEKYPYKVGDKVKVKETGKDVIIDGMSWRNGCEVIYDTCYNNDCVSFYSAEELQPYKEETMEDIIKIDIPKGYEFAGIDDDNQQVVFEKIGYQYQKTYEECAKIMNCPIDGPSGWLFNFDANIKDKYYRKIDILMGKFTRLLICRDAYWKIAGEQIGLGKPWNQDYDDRCFIIANNNGNIHTYEYHGSNNVILAFPTAEMRDAFYENFKDLIEQCKELL